MWATTTTPQSFLPTPTPTPKLPQPPATTVQSRRRYRHLAVNSSADDTGGLGQAMFNALQSGPSTNKAQQEGKPNKGNDISGSDILRAMQRASAKKAKAKNQQKKKGSSELKKDNNNNKGKFNSNKVVDYDKIRPITVKSEWATRLTDLEKRLQEFSLL